VLSKLFQNYLFYK